MGRCFVMTWGMEWALWVDMPVAFLSDRLLFCKKRV